MNIVKYIVLLSVIYFSIYLVSILTAFVSMILGFFTPDEFLKILGVIGSFLTLFFSMMMNYFKKHKFRDMGRVSQRFNIQFCIVTIVTVILLGLAIEMGVLLDALNIGLTKPYHFDIYFLIVQGSLGVYTGDIVSTIFEHK